MQRQLRNNGGVMTVKTIRKKYGIGSDLKDFVRKIIPNEIADVAVKAAPIVAPFYPGTAALMRGIGRFDQRGSLSDAFKQGALTYAGGRGVRYLGGAEGASGGLGSYSKEGFKQGPIGSLFKSDPTKTISKVDQGLDVTPGTITEKTIGKVPIVNKLPKFVQQQLLAGGVTAGASLLASYFQGEFREHDPETESYEEYLAQRKKVVGSQMRTYMDNYFKFDKEYSTMTDEQKNAFVARYNLRDGGRIRAGIMNASQMNKGGRIGFQNGSKDNATKINELVEKGMSMDEAIKKITPGAKSSVEFTREELGLGPLKINQEIDKLLKEGVDIEIIKSMTGATDELIQERIKIVRFSQEAPERFMKVFGPNKEVMFIPSNEMFKDASDRRMFEDAPRKLTLEEQIIQKIREKSKPKKAKGGLMNIPVRTNSEGIKELDMRKSGGFVPIGVKEKADDVPAMLSKNEFVMTADAVRAAGGGSINKGAQRMYDTMKKLESRVA